MTWANTFERVITIVALKMTNCCIYVSYNFYLWDEVRKVGCFLFGHLILTESKLKYRRSGRPSVGRSFGLLFETCLSLWSRLGHVKSGHTCNNINCAPLLPILKQKIAMI